jgi:hypothetical protein
MFMNIEDEISIRIIDKYMNTLGNKLINKMTCSDVKYNFSVSLVDLYKGEERWKFSDDWRNNYDYVVVIDSEIPVSRVVCNEYKEKYLKDEVAISYPLLWAFVPVMKEELRKYLSVDLDSVSFGKAGIHFNNYKKL